jgi:hypothetical protein
LSRKEKPGPTRKIDRKKIKGGEDEETSGINLKQS